MKSIKKTAALPLEKLSEAIMCATEVESKGDGFIATFQLCHCHSMPKLGISENPKLRWYSPSKCVAPCNYSGNALYGFTYIASAISRGLADYTAILGKFRVLHEDNKVGGHLV